ncbi:hypothetical protein L1278_000835 [Pontibacter sp. HSC-36F09]|nr:hypothetical protein [Pontibacter sp. HSC-36F09]
MNRYGAANRISGGATLQEHLAGLSLYLSTGGH